MNKLLPHTLWLLLGAWHALGEPVPVVSYSRNFQLRNRPDRYTLHVLKPAPEGEAGDVNGHEGLRKFAAFVREDATNKKFINDVTRERYERELRRLEEGYWPTVWITREGSDEVLVGLSYAIRWGDERMPFQESFYDLGIPAQPKEDPLVQRLVEPLKDFKFHKYKSLHYLPTDLYLTELLQGRPYIGGTDVEIKFLVGTQFNPVRFLQVIHGASMDFELHRDSRVKISEEASELYRRYVRELGELRESYPQFIRDPTHPNPEEDRRLTEFFHKHLYDESWQKYVRNTRVFIQASDLADHVDPHSKLKNLHYRLFVQKLGFPAQVFWRFRENERIGTNGVITRILSASTQDYEWVTGAELTFYISGEDITNAVIYSPDAPQPCREIYSQMELALDDYMIGTRH